MLRFLFRRAVLALLVCLTVLVVSFALTRLSGDLAISIAGPNATAQDIEIIRKAYGLDRPLPLQFFDWAAHAAAGRSRPVLFLHAPVAGLIKERLPITLTLGLIGLVIALMRLDPARHPRGDARGHRARQGDRAVRAVRPGDAELLAGAGADHLLGLQLQLLPISGIDTWDGYVMPGIVLAFSAIPALMRLTRAGMIDALSSDYIRTARAKGLSARDDRAEARAAQRGDAGGVDRRGAARLHAGRLDRHRDGLRAAWRRLSRLGAISKNDFPVVQAVVLVLAVIYIGLTLLADMMNAVLDPRLRAA